jgi:hypothetical protein
MKKCWEKSLDGPDNAVSIYYITIYLILSSFVSISWDQTTKSISLFIFTLVVIPIVVYLVQWFVFDSILNLWDISLDMSLDRSFWVK